MLNDGDFLIWCARLGLTEDGMRYGCCGTVAYSFSPCWRRSSQRLRTLSQP